MKRSLSRSVRPSKPLATAEGRGGEGREGEGREGEGEEGSSGSVEV